MLKPTNTSVTNFIVRILHQKMEMGLYVDKNVYVYVCVCVRVCTCMCAALDLSWLIYLVSQVTIPKKKDTGLFVNYDWRDTNTYTANYSYTPITNSENGEET